MHSVPKKHYFKGPEDLESHAKDSALTGHHKKEEDVEEERTNLLESPELWFGRVPASLLGSAVPRCSLPLGRFQQLQTAASETPFFHWRAHKVAWKQDTRSTSQTNGKRRHPQEERGTRASSVFTTCTSSNFRYRPPNMQSVKAAPVQTPNKTGEEGQDPARALKKTTRLWNRQAGRLWRAVSSPLWTESRSIVWPCRG
ncbi:hypothetical protein ACOMHN_042481 [Nucella lapillus]